MSTLVGWWKGENNTIDSVNGNDAIITTTVDYVAGQVNQCFRLYDKPASLQIPYISAYDFSIGQKFTIDFWFKVTYNPLSGWGSRLTFGKNVNADAGYFIDIIKDPSTHQISIQKTNGSAQNYTACFTPGQWTHLKAVFDNTRFELYLDDILNVPDGGTYYNFGTLVFNWDIYAWTNMITMPYEQTYAYIDEIKIYDDSGLGKKTVSFTDASKGLIASTDFDFGDGSAHATELPVDHEYDLDAIGSPYTVDATLTVTDTKGNSDTITKTIDLS